MKKQLANIISGSRIVAAIPLFFFKEINTPFLILFTYCGFSDLIDGPIARKLNTTSILGTYLDAVGDILMFLAMGKILIFVQKAVPTWVVIWLLTGLIGNVIGAGIAKKRHGTFYFVHSLFDKLLSNSLFVLPFALKFAANINHLDVIWYAVICTIGSLSGIETIYIQLKSKEQITNVSSLKQLKNL